MQKILDSRLTTLALVAAITVFAVHVVAMTTERARVDLTADDLYSLSEGTVSILDRMAEEGTPPITMKLYFSETTGKSLPKFVKDFLVYRDYVESLLHEYEIASDGRIEVRVLDPVTDSDDAVDALDHGLDGKPINQHGDLFFFGLALQTKTGSRDAIEFLWPHDQESIEYEITKRLHSLVWPTKKRVGVLSSLEVVSEASNPYMQQILQAQGKAPGQTWIAAQLLEEQYEVVRLDPDTDRIDPEEVDLVVVIHPRQLGTRARWALDEWVVRGGNALVFVDPYTLADQPPRDPQQPWAAYQYDPSSNLPELFSAWGLERPDHLVAADANLAVRRPVQQRGPAEQILVDLRIDGTTRERTLAAGHPVFQGMDDLRLFLPGTLEWTAPEGSALEMTPLVTTTDAGGTLEIHPGFPEDDKLVFSDVNSPGKLRDAFAPAEEPAVVALQLTGRFPSAFPDGADLPAETPAPPPGLPPGIELPEPEGGERIAKDAVPEDERADASVVVFADVDFVTDSIAFQQTPIGAIAVNDNHKVLLNAVDYLFGSEDLMKVRAKSSIERPFLLFDEIEAEADLASQEREAELRAEIEQFQEELREKQASIGARNAALFEKQLQDEVDALNERIEQANRELRDIRRARREALESEEARVRFATLFTTPSLVLALGLALWLRRRQRDREARRNAQ